MSESLHRSRVDLICQRSNGVQGLRQVSAIPDGYMKNRSQIWRISKDRARSFAAVDLIDYREQFGVGIFGHGSTRSWFKVWATATGRRYVELCREAARLSNLSWPEHPYGDHRDTGYLTWQAEWLERRERFTQALLEMEP